jgi:hypothetical protein
MDAKQRILGPVKLVVKSTVRNNTFTTTTKDIV